MTQELHIGTAMTRLRISGIEQADALRIAKERRDRLLAIARERKQSRIAYLYSGFRRRWMKWMGLGSE